MSRRQLQTVCTCCHCVQAGPAAALEQLRLAVAGPPEPTWITRDARDALLAQEALGVVELVCGLGTALDAAPVSYLQLVHAARWPLRSAVLPPLYVALLRTCLLEVIQQEAPCAFPHLPATAQMLSSLTMCIQ